MTSKHDGTNGGEVSSITHELVTIDKDIEAKGTGVVVEYTIKSNSDEPVRYTFADEVPSMGDSEVGFHPDYIPNSWSEEEETVVIEDIVAGSGESHFKLGMMLENWDVAQFESATLDIRSAHTVDRLGGKQADEAEPGENTNLLQKAKDTLFSSDNPQSPPLRSDGSHGTIPDNPSEPAGNPSSTDSETGRDQTPDVDDPLDLEDQSGTSGNETDHFDFEEPINEPADEANSESSAADQSAVEDAEAEETETESSTVDQTAVEDAEADETESESSAVEQSAVEEAETEETESESSTAEQSAVEDVETEETESESSAAEKSAVEEAEGKETESEEASNEMQFIENEDVDAEHGDGQVSEHSEVPERFEETSSVSTDQTTRDSVAALSSDLRSGEASEEDIEAIQEALDITESRSEAVKRDHLQARLDDFAAYADILSDFIDEYGTLTDFAAELQAENAEVRADIMNVREEIETLGNTQSALRSQVEQMETSLATLQDDVETVQNDVGAVQADIAAVQDDVESGRQEMDADIAEIQSHLDRLSDSLEDVEENTDAELAQIRRTVDEFDTVYSSLKDAFEPTGDEDES